MFLVGGMANAQVNRTVGVMVAKDNELRIKGQEYYLLDTGTNTCFTLEQMTLKFIVPVSFYIVVPCMWSQSFSLRSSRVIRRDMLISQPAR